MYTTSDIAALHFQKNFFDFISTDFRRAGLINLDVPEELCYNPNGRKPKPIIRREGSHRRRIHGFTDIVMQQVKNEH